MHNHSNGLRNLLSLFSYLLVSISLSLTNGGTEYHCYDSGNFTTNSAYDTNRFLILSSLSSHVTIDNGGFYSTSIGQDPDKVYAVALCRGDSPSNEHCVNSIKAASRDILTKCPNQKEAFIWGGGTPECLVHYADHPVFGKLDLPHRRIEYGGNLTEVVKSNLTEFDQIWERLTDGLVKKVSTGSSRLKFATDEADINTLQMIYALMQCTPDLPRSDCELCLRQCVADWNCCRRTEGGNSERANCYFGWALYPFYSPPTKAPLPPSTDTPQIEASPPAVLTDPLQAKDQGGKDQKNERRLLIIILITVAMAILLIGTIVCYLKRKFILKSRMKNRTSATENLSCNGHNLLVLSFTTIREATDNFASGNKIGEGGYGPVYKGRLPIGQEVAVKRLSKFSHQGSEEFKNEVKLTARLQHVNLVPVLGICNEKEEKMLIYEFMPNKSLDFYIFDLHRRHLLDWGKRVDIIEGITQGLLYLQEYSNFTIIHRDLKASNILLDSEMNPKISDFGMAKAFTKDECEANTGRIVGTYGYVPPEYVRKGIYSMKYDVYSFGVLLLQIISGKRTACYYGPNDSLNLLEFAYKLWKDGEGMEFFDSSLDDSSSTWKLMRCMQVALLCVQENPAERPTMLEVYTLLKNETVTITTPRKPAFSFTRDEDEESNKCASKVNICSINDASITELVPR